MAENLTPQAISGIEDPESIRMALFINNQMVHAPVLDVVMTTVAAAASTFANTKVTVFTSSGTFTPDPKMIECEVTAFGGGGGGGGSTATGAGVVSTGSGGNGGAKAQRRLTRAQVGASQTVTIGAGGTGVSGADGNPGGNTTFGALVSAKGGEGGFTAAAAAGVSASGKVTTQSATGDLRGWTHQATMAGYGNGAPFGVLGTSGQGELGGGVAGTVTSVGSAAGANTAAGGGGTLNVPSQPARTGGAGGSGLLVVREYLAL